MNFEISVQFVSWNECDKDKKKKGKYNQKKYLKKKKYNLKKL